MINLSSQRNEIKKKKKNIMRMTHEAVKGLKEDTRLLPIYPKEKKEKENDAILSCPSLMF